MPNALIEINPCSISKIHGIKAKKINKILDSVALQGLTCVLTMVYWKENKIKCDIAIGKGKKTYDQREDVKQRDCNREKQRILKNSNR